MLSLFIEFKIYNRNVSKNCFDLYNVETMDNFILQLVFEKNL